MSIRGNDTNLRLTKSVLFAAVTAVAIGGPTQLAAQTTPQFTETNKGIKLLAAQGTDYYVNFHEPFGQQCIWDVAYIANDKKGLYATLMAAYLSGKRVHKITYTQPGGNGSKCNLDQVELAS